MRKFNAIVVLALICVWGSILFSTFVQASTSRSSQSCTAYPTTGNKMANGEWPEIGDVAVHPTVKAGNSPVIPFGTYLYIDYIKSQNGVGDSVFYSPEGEITVLKVGDIGDKKFDRGLTKYWVDLYFGNYYTKAKSWGKGTITYHYN